MAYTKQTWASDDLITAQKLNHIEDGISGVYSDTSYNLNYIQSQIIAINSSISNINTSLQEYATVQQLSQEIAYLQSQINQLRG